MPTSRNFRGILDESATIASTKRGNTHTSKRLSHKLENDPSNTYSDNPGEGAKKPSGDTSDDNVNMPKGPSVSQQSHTASNKIYAVRGPKQKRHSEDRSEDRSPVEQGLVNSSESQYSQSARQRRREQCNGPEEEHERQTDCGPTRKSALPYLLRKVFVNRNNI
ncbi:hypothetical protein BDZ91DRAFT_44258 [Kalaharituber pfeilii]|nr:hypothetical protein BDZ91DRAFT_44258 [Kalaharituber pfeilii]